MRLAAVFSALALSSAAQAGVLPAEAERQLEFLVRDWTIEGHEAGYRETCRWYEKKSFVVCDSEDRTEGEAAFGVTLFGWSVTDGHFTYHRYADNGRSRSDRCFASDRKGLTCVGEKKSADGLVQYRAHIWPVAGGLSFYNEQSVNGGPWKTMATLKYVPRK